MPGDHPHRHLVPPAGWLSPPAEPDQAPSPGFLLGVTLLAAALRFFELTGQSLWVDEMLTWQVVGPDLGRSFFEQIGDCIQGPLYMSVIWPLVRIQESALSLRLPAAVMGTLAVPLFGIVAGRLAGGRAGRLAVFLFALSPFHIWYSQEGRGYALLIFFALAMAWLYLEMVRRGPGPWLAILFGLAAGGAGLSNLSGMFLWAGMGAALLIVDRPGDRRAWGWWALAFGLGGVLVAPWLLKASGIWAVDRVLPGGGTGTALRGETTFSLLALPYTIQTFFYGYSLGPSTSELHQPDRLALLKSAAPLLAIGALPVGFGLLASLRRPNRNFWRQIFWIAIPVAILVLLAVRNIKPWNPRYVAMTLPWFLILASVGWTMLPRRMGLVLVLVVTGLTLWSVGNYFGNSRYAKADVRAAAAFVDEQDTEGLPILVPVVTGVFDFYHQGPSETLGTYGLPPLRTAAQADAFVVDKLAGADAAWVVLARAWYFDPDGLLPTALARAGHLRLVAEPAGTEIYSWNRVTAAKDDHGP